jgi:hypothetical protein
MRPIRSGRPGRLKAVLWLLPLLAGTAGCGSPKVSGKITYKGEPLHTGKVMITAANGWVGASLINEDGTYSIPNVPPGPAKIAVDTQYSDPVPLSPAARQHKKRPPPPPEAMKVPSGLTIHPPVKIPDKYKQPETSGLTLEVTGGRQTFDINLE